MPSLRLQTADGYTLTCDSSNPETVAAWLLEMTQRYVSDSTSNMPLRLYIYPVYSSIDGGPDWPVRETHVQAEPSKFLDALMETLYEINARATLKSSGG